jgi:uncharacterized integral membrane protein (TIGR00697 family)
VVPAPVSPNALREAALRRQTLLVWLCALFVGFFVTAELLGAKLWRFTLLGLTPRHMGLDGAEFVATAGILAFPLTFILTDIINEYFGLRVVRLFTFAAIGVNVLLQVVVQVAIRVPTISFTEGVDDATLHQAYHFALGQSWAIVVASLVAFLIGQLLDVHVFSLLRRISGGKWLWLRAQGSTVVSQLVDTFVVIYLAFVVIPAIVPTGQGVLSGSQAFEVSITNYVYKFAIAVGITPLLYVVHGLVDLYLGKEQADALVREAHPR